MVLRRTRIMPLGRQIAQSMTFQTTHDTATWGQGNSVHFKCLHANGGILTTNN